MHLLHWPHHLFHHVTQSTTSIFAAKGVEMILPLARGYHFLTIMRMMTIMAIFQAHHGRESFSSAMPFYFVHCCLSLDVINGPP